MVTVVYGGTGRPTEAHLGGVGRGVEHSFSGRAEPQPHKRQQGVHEPAQVPKQVDLVAPSKATYYPKRTVGQPGSAGSRRPMSHGVHAWCSGPPRWLCEVACLTAEGHGAERSAPFVACGRQAVFMLWSCRCLCDPLRMPLSNYCFAPDVLSGAGYVLCWSF